MGLDCSHDAWHGSYSAFHRWRCEIAKTLRLPPLELMEGFFKPDPYETLYFGQRVEDEVYAPKRGRLEESLPIKWDCLKWNPVFELLFHSDCEGYIPSRRCKRIADELEKLIPLLPQGDVGGHIGNWRDKTQTFVDGLRSAAAAHEPLQFR